MYTDYSYHTSSQRSLWYYLVFPVDAWSRHDTPEYDTFFEQKRHEIFPIFRLLIPVIVLLAAFSLSVGFFGSLFFYAIESLLLGLVCAFYVKLPNGGFVIELIINFWISFVLTALCLTITLFFFGLLF